MTNTLRELVERGYTYEFVTDSYIDPRAYHKHLVISKDGKRLNSFHGDASEYMTKQAADWLRYQDD